MLQQTTVATVGPRFERFVERWPTIEALAAASDEDILSEWAGLGYYARARNLIACAREVARARRIPAHRRRACASFRASAPIPPRRSPRSRSANGPRRSTPTSQRVIARLHRSARASAAETRTALPRNDAAERPGDFVQAMMDLGATICRPKKPRCGECPLQRDVRAFASGKPGSIPCSEAARARDRTASASPIGSSAMATCGWCAALPRGCSAEWRRFREATGPKLRRPASTPRHGPPRLHPFLAGPSRRPSHEPVGEGWWQPIDRLDRGRAADPLSKRPHTSHCPHRSAVPPESFFSGAGLDRADLLRRRRCACGTGDTPRCARTRVA